MRSTRRELAGVPAWMWLGGLVVSLAMIGPGLRRGALLNLDLLVIDELPVPHGMWGLGPELPRRVPLFGPMAWASSLLGGELVGKSLLVASIVVAAAGMYRLMSAHVPSLGVPAAVGAAALYGVGPFLLTRLAVGQLSVVWVMAVLPWALPYLLEPSKHPRRLLWWSATLGLGGVFGAIIVGTLLTAGVVADRARNWRPTALAFFVGQLPWLSSLAVVTLTSERVAIASSSSFRPRLNDVADGARLFAGYGYWNGQLQVGREFAALAAVFGPLLFIAALLGTRELPRSWRVPLTAVGLGSLILSASSSIAGIERVVNAFTDTPAGAPLRETQRFLVPYLLWLCPAAAAGATRVARRFGASVGATLRIAPLAVAATLAGPALWGLGGQLDPASFPKEWRDARQLVHEQPGTVVALPWYQYFTLDIAHNHLVLNVVPYYFGGDVLASSDPHLAPGPQQEAPDPREVPMNAIVADARNGQEISDRLVSLGIRWVVLQHDVDWKLYTGIPADRGLERVVSGATLDLYRVNAWRGPVLGDDGAAVPTQTIVAPLRQIDRSGPATFLAPYQSGWLRGWSSASRTSNGLIGLPPGAGLLWFWPALVVLGADLVVLATLLSSVVPGRLRRYWNSETSHTRAEMLDGLRADE